ncbi:hypothetical protein JQ599_30715 [Bradyrhizobium diazoefficiens]|nr:hypothetical protein [Bradyrhizobium diazoefficiens]MBR0704315.1 hypothetical protein [Bradyrhizobium diazoefficiens]MBR0772753.1 hypothetical protein [Bradyrhizobium diazoefficiens]
MTPRYARQQRIVDSSFFDVPMILTESGDEFVSLRKGLFREMNPQGILEEIFVRELVVHTWEMCRLMRCRTLLINMAFKHALEALLRRIVSADEEEDDEEWAALARRWFTDPNAKKAVSELLASVQLDEAAIVAQAMRSEFENLQELDRMIRLQQSLRDKLLRSLVKYRKSFSLQVEEAIARIEDRSSLESRPG